MHGRMRFLMFALIACGSSATTTITLPTTKPASDPACPIAVAGTSVTVEDTDTGAALVFVTTGDVADVRRRAGVMAQQHNEHHAAMGPLPDGTSTTNGTHDHGAHEHANGGGTQAGMKGSMIGVHSKAMTGEITGGAKLVFVAGAPDVGKLQSELRMHAQHYAAGSCEMK
jgi:hypothetical protein